MKYLDLFSGYGGFSLGIQQAYALQDLSDAKEYEHEAEDSVGRERGLDADTKIRLGNPECIGFCEIDKYATQVYKHKFPTHKEYGDITKLDPSTLPDFDLLTGGFPCQAFSIAGKRHGFEDTRGTLIFDVFRILKEKQPRLVLLENVKGLLSHDNGRTFKTIITALAELGYAVEWQVLNAKNFGVPQNRERVFIIGHLGGFGGRKIFPIGESEGQTNEVNIQKRYGSSPRPIWRVSDSESTRREIQSSHQIRRLTPVECERLMGLPDGWTAEGTEGKISDTQRYKLCGNGVVVNVVEEIIKKLI